MLISFIVVPLAYRTYKLETASLSRKCQICRREFPTNILQCKICDKQFCSSCIALHTHTCEYCGREITSQDDFAVCSVCHRLLCNQCASLLENVCPACGFILCQMEQYVPVCSICLNLIEYPRKSVKCEMCGKIICESCMGMHRPRICIVCGRTICPDCWNDDEKFPKCKQCAHSNRCEICGIEKKWFLYKGTVEKTCSICGFSLCSRCWDYDKNLCVRCAEKISHIRYPRRTIWRID